ncbi:cation diffusion facilitator family transporter [Pullulanibacillus pueri]|uniref:Putative transporter YdfM n=1 Tax=Pullulanibacillus pueri TaxID=1437324 RepID=A0A8J2ZW25_9BACL|nr:cation diffusion facilitator family transporter [Pullulanibacillus pueri]MBM7682186.1 cation diffusion facilitator family transporter [Pullulanibacillus pueri]GGH80370.1 putative transporter YdfM [Pullulanibacillus pueri]
MVKRNYSGWFIAWISLIFNFVLTVVKVLVGYIFHSTALLADGIHNGGDVIASLATLSSMKVANQPADKEHPYGHGKAEDISSSFISLILLIAGLYLIYESIVALFMPAKEANIWALLAAIVSLIVKGILYFYTMRYGKRTKSKSLIATAYDHLADVWASLAAAIGIGIAWVGNLYSIPYAVYGDPIAGIVVSILIIKVGVEMGIKSINVLMEGNVSAEQIEIYSNMIKTFPEVKRIDKLRAREHGNYILIDVRISVPGTLTIQEGHDITRQIRDSIMTKDPNVEEVLIHLNPWYATPLPLKK